jgi:hypothetical protein
MEAANTIYSDSQTNDGSLLDLPEEQHTYLQVNTVKVMYRKFFIE